MARITVEDCLRKVENRFLLVNLVAKRVRQIREGSEYLVNAPKNEDIVISLREVAAGKVVQKSEDDIEVKSIETQGETESIEVVDESEEVQTEEDVQ